MEEILILGLSISLGAFFFILVMVCCLRFMAYLKDEDRKHLCFRRKQGETRRRVQRSLFSEGIFTTTGYTAAPDENLTEISLCQPYVYEDGCSTGMRMIANLPIAIAFTSNSGIPNSNHSIYSYCPPSPMFQHDTIIEELEDEDEPPPPDYSQAQRIEIEQQEPPPPSYDECMHRPQTQLHM